MAVWERFGLNGTGAALGAGAVVVLLGGAYLIVSQRAAPVTEVAVGTQPVAAVTDGATNTGTTSGNTPAETVTQTGAASTATSPAEPASQTATSESPATESLAAENSETQERTDTELASIDPDSAPNSIGQTDEASSSATPQAAPQDESSTQADVASPDIAAPVFDLVRIDPLGSAVIAGTAQPDAMVQLMIDGGAIAEVVADASGKFVALLELGPSESPRNLTALARTDAGSSPSDGTVLISPVRAPVAVAEATPDTTEGAADQGIEEDIQIAAVAPDAAPTAPQPSESATSKGEATSAATGGTESTVSNSAAPAVTETATQTTQSTAAPTATEDPVAPPAEVQTPPAAPSIVVADSSGVRVLQPPAQPQVPTATTQDQTTEAAPRVTSNVVIDTITYDTSGEVALAGRGQGEGFVRVYLNERAIKTTEIEADGSWNAELPDVDAGIYRLRIDEVDASGEVTSRVETPFKREAPEIVEGTVQAVTVQPGFTLWGIAERRFGEGIQYVRVYEANRDLIRDPDLIYPGQVFALPE